MKVAVAERARNQYLELPRSIQRKFDKQLEFLLLDLRHPSLMAKKYDESRDIWQGRVDRGYRFYFQIRGDVYFILAVVAHPK